MNYALIEVLGAGITAEKSVFSSVYPVPRYGDRKHLVKTLYCTRVQARKPSRVLLPCRASYGFEGIVVLPCLQFLK